MKNWQKTFVIGLLISVLLPFSLVQAGVKEQGQLAPVKLGFIGPFSGAWAEWAEGYRNGFHLALEDMKHNVEVVFADDACQPKNSVNAATKMLTVDKIQILFGPGCLMNVKAVAPIAKKYGAIIFGPGGLDREILENHDNVIDISSSVDSEAKYLAAYLADQTSAKTVAILHGTNAFGEELGRGMVRELSSRGIAVTVREQAEFNTRQYRAIVLKLTRGNPDAIFVHQGESSTGLFVKALRAIGYTKPVYGPFTVESEAALRSGGSAMDGIRYTYNFNNAEGSEQKQLFERRYRRRFKRIPSAHAFIVYDAMMQFDKALDSCETGNAQCILNYFKILGLENGISGEIVHGQDGGALRPYGIKQIRNGNFEWVVRKIVL